MEKREVCLPTGAVLKNRYELISVIGMGGFGIIYRAMDRLLDCQVAVKEFFFQDWMTRDRDSCEAIFSGTGEDREMMRECLLNFRHEAEILEAVKDVPYVSRLKDHFEENGTEYMVLNLIRGRSLSEYAKDRGGRLPAREVLSLLQNTFDTLSQLHRMGLIHRDISPGNLMLSEDRVVYLIDFGSATSFRGEDGLQSRQVFQHKGLEAPEHARPDRQGPWTDVFSLCATMVYLLTGEGIVEAGDRQRFDYLPRLLMKSSLSSGQQNALLKGLNPEISLRFPGVEQLYAELYGEPMDAADFPEEWPVFYHARTDIGSRPVNQDNFMVDTVFYYKGEDCEQSGTLNCRPEEIHVAAVCDGVGGSSHGELAAKAAIQAIIHFAESHPEGETPPNRLLEELLDQINEKVLQLGEKIGRTATTLSLLLWQGNRYYAVNIGDSPIFFLRKGKLKRISTSHTRAELNLMLQRPVQRSDWNTMLRFLGKKGVSGSQMASFCYGKLQKGDTFLICSDGVSKRIEESRLKHFLGKRGRKSMAAMFRVIGRSVHNDNCTAIVLKF